MAKELTVNGPDNVMQMHDDAVYRNTIARMFRSSFLELFTKVHPVVPGLIFVPVLAWALWTSAEAVGLMTVPLALAGVLFWTITEYTLHRWLFHIAPTNLVSRITYVYLHGIHHHYPDDHFRLVMVPVVSVPLAFGFWFLFGAILPPALVSGAFAGMVVGYLAYDYCHYATHHIKIPRGAWAKPLASILRTQRKRHLMHHFGNHDKGFGVSTGLWDHVFGSVDPNLRAGSDKPATPPKAA